MAHFEFNGAWTLGNSQRSNLFANEAGRFPGPGNYSLPNFKNKPRSPEVQFAKGRRSINYDNGMPGPGKYKIGFNHLEKNISMKISKPHPIAQKPATIGPGTYDPKGNVESSKTKQPTFSFGYKVLKEVISDTPAPNAYYPQYSTSMYSTRNAFASNMKSDSMNDITNPQGNQSKMGRSQSSIMKITRNGFGSTQRMKPFVNDAPGPGEYSSNLLKQNNGPTFAKSQRHWIMPSDHPGPGAFNPNDNQQRTNGFSLGQKLHDSLKTYENYVPGPGAYDGDKPRSKSGITFGTEQKHSMVDKESLKKPGPNFYYPIMSNTKSELFVPTIGFSNRQPLSQTGNNPGPGEYENQKIGGEGPKWRMAQKFQKKNKEDIPGPGQYDVQTESLVYQRPKFGHTNGPRSNPIRSEFANTGPGAYDISVKFSANRNGITISEKFYNRKRNYEPGPGSCNNLFFLKY